MNRVIPSVCSTPESRRAQKKKHVSNGRLRDCVIESSTHSLGLLLADQWLNSPLARAGMLTDPPMNEAAACRSRLASVRFLTYS